MTDSLINADNQLFLFLNSFHNGFWDIFMSVATGKLIWIPLYLSIVFAIWIKLGWKKTILAVLMCALAVTLADQFTASLLRPYFSRLRPAHPDNPISEFVHIVNGYRGGNYGFPSCHASNTFSAAMFLTLLFRKRIFTFFIFLWALLNCYSRLYLGVHYPGDLLAGMIIGLLSGFLVYLLYVNFKTLIFNKNNNTERLPLASYALDDSNDALKVPFYKSEYRVTIVYIPVLTEASTILFIFIYSLISI